MDRPSAIELQRTVNNLKFEQLRLIPWLNSLVVELANPAAVVPDNHFNPYMHGANVIQVGNLTLNVEGRTYTTGMMVVIGATYRSRHEVDGMDYVMDLIDIPWGAEFPQAEKEHGGLHLRWGVEMLRQFEILVDLLGLFLRLLRFDTLRARTFGFTSDYFTFPPSIRVFGARYYTIPRVDTRKSSQLLLQRGYTEDPYMSRDRTGGPGRLMFNYWFTPPLLIEGVPSSESLAKFSHAGVAATV